MKNVFVEKNQPQTIINLSNEPLLVQTEMNSSLRTKQDRLRLGNKFQEDAR